MSEQLVDWFAAPRWKSYGVPGPSHTTLPPAPKSHVLRIGRADTVADSPGMAAVFVVGSHSFTQSQVFKPTKLKWSRPGAVAGSGRLTSSCADACCASICGLITGAAAGPPYARKSRVTAPDVWLVADPEADRARGALGVELVQEGVA